MSHVGAFYLVNHLYGVMIMKTKTIRTYIPVDVTIPEEHIEMVMSKEWQDSFYEFADEIEKPEPMTFDKWFTRHYPGLSGYRTTSLKGLLRNAWYAAIASTKEN
jgi:hypothetical protein